MTYLVKSEILFYYYITFEINLSLSLSLSLTKPLILAILQISGQSYSGVKVSTLIGSRLAGEISVDWDIRS
jgi:hypothetical protein